MSCKPTCWFAWSPSVSPHNTATDVGGVIDPSDNIGFTWDRFRRGKKVLKLRCSPKSLLLKTLFLCCVIAVAFYHKPLLSAISLFSVGATLEGYATLFCHIDSDKELQCLVHMQTQMPKRRRCNITHGDSKYNFCGAFTRWYTRLHTDTYTLVY